MKKVVVEPFNLDLFVFDDRKECMEFIMKNHADQEQASLIENEEEGIFLQFNNYPNRILFYGNPKDVEHEIIHATWYILDHVGIPLSVDNHEIQCYLFEHIKRLILSHNTLKE